MSIEIKRLKQKGTEFVPITLAEAVVVNTNNIPGIADSTITTLDKVLQSLGLSLNDLTTALNGKQDALTAGAGITIQNGVISTSAVTTLYKILTVEQFEALSPSKDCQNIIYLVPASSVARNSFIEYICIYKEENSTYYWEQLGQVQTDVDLSGYVTLTEYESFKASAITAVNVTTSANQAVVVTYDIPTTLYDDIVTI